MEITTGTGLSAVVQSETTVFGDWTAFAACYSLAKFLPDAEVCLQLEKKPYTKQLFIWANKLKTKFSKPSNTKVIYIKPLTMLVRELTDIDMDHSICSAKSDDLRPFVCYAEGCGKFVVSAWIYKEECPFSEVDRLVDHGMTANEMQVLKLWKQASLVYRILTKG